MLRTVSDPSSDMNGYHAHSQACSSHQAPLPVQTYQAPPRGAGFHGYMSVAPPPSQGGRSESPMSRYFEGGGSFPMPVLAPTMVVGDASASAWPQWGCQWAPIVPPVSTVHR